MNRDAMRQFILQHCLLTGDSVRLSGGGAANFYFDCKRATLNGAFLDSLSNWILEKAQSLQPAADVIGGPTIGADFIAAAAIMRAAQCNIPLQHAAIVRKEPKKHGAQNKIENEPVSASRIFIVEDVITTGGSIARACDEFLAAGHAIAGIAAIIDRQAGGVEALTKQYQTPVFSLFTKSDFGKI